MSVWPSAVGRIVVLFVVLTCGPAWAAEPDFSNVTDILGGQRHLLRDGDLVVTGAFGGSEMPSVLTLRTADSKVSIRAPQSCHRRGRTSARLSTALTITTPNQPSVEIAPKLFWRCSPHELRTP